MITGPTPSTAFQSAPALPGRASKWLSTLLGFDLTAFQRGLQANLCLPLRTQRFTCIQHDDDDPLSTVPISSDNNKTAINTKMIRSRLTNGAMLDPRVILRSIPCFTRQQSVCLTSTYRVCPSDKPTILLFCLSPSTMTIPFGSNQRSKPLFPTWGFFYPRKLP